MRASTRTTLHVPGFVGHGVACDLLFLMHPEGNAADNTVATHCID